MGRKRIEIPERRLRELYWDEEKTASEIATMYGCAPATVLSRMGDHNIPRRAPGGTPSNDPIQPCASCGDEGGRACGSNNRPSRRDASRFGIAGEVCETCYQRLYRRAYRSSDNE